MNKEKINFDDYTINYNSLINQDTSFFSQNDEYFAKYKVAILKHELGNFKGRLLEFGCGIGRNIPYLSVAFPDAKIFGSDISRESLEVARKENPTVEFLVEHENSNTELTFDAIFVAGVFHHIPVSERNTAMKSIHSRLSPDGTIIIFEQNPYNPITRRIVNKCPFDRGVVLLRPSELKKLLKLAGLNICHHSYCLFIPPSLQFLLPLESKLGWLPLGGQYWIRAKRSV